jgi:hypothetical protein
VQVIIVKSVPHNCEFQLNGWRINQLAEDIVGLLNALDNYHNNKFMVQNYKKYIFKLRILYCLKIKFLRYYTILLVTF